jgi:hypothetical protein
MRCTVRCWAALAATAATLLLMSCGGGTQDALTTPSATDSRKTVSSVAALAAIENLSVTAVALVAERRVSRTVYEYDFALTVSNVSDKDYSNVKAELVTVGPGTTVVSGVVLVGALAARSSVTPSGVIRVRHDRLAVFSRALLTWSVQGDAQEPAPDLRGADDNANGIRDDVESFISQRYSTNPPLAAALSQLARALQQSAMASSKEAASNAAAARFSAALCVAHREGRGEARRDIGAVKNRQFNTRERQSREWEFSNSLSGDLREFVPTSLGGTCS